MSDNKNLIEYDDDDDNDKNQLSNSSSNGVTNEKLKWYVIHTYSGYENKVKANIDKIVDNRNMRDLISEVTVPVQEDVELTKSGKKKVVQRKIFPGYVFLKMVMNDDTWFIVRNTRGVTSFVGPGSKPVALTESEVMAMGIEGFVETCDIKEGDSILVIDGPFAKSNGTVKEVNINKRCVIITVNFFGRETLVELNFNQVQRLG